MSEFVCIDFDEFVEDRETKAAVLVMIDDEKVWFPKSHIDRIYYNTNKIYVTE